MNRLAALCAAARMAWAALGQSSFAQVSGWIHGDIGTVGVSGNSVHDAGTDTYTVTGSGAGISGTADAFQFMSRSLSGDGEIVARVVTQNNTGTGARAGLMIRDGTAAGARHAYSHTTISNGLYLQSRSGTNGSSVATNAAGAAPKWLKLVREGTLISGYQSADGSIRAYYSQQRDLDPEARSNYGTDKTSEISENGN